MTVDWAALMESMITAVGTVLTEIIGALTTNATTIAELLIGGVIVGFAVKFGDRAIRGLTGAFKGLMD